MKNTNVLHLCIGVLVLFFVVSCSKDEITETETTELEQTTTVDAKAAAFTYTLETTAISTKEEELSLELGPKANSLVFVGSTLNPGFTSLQLITDPIAPWAKADNELSNTKAFILNTDGFGGRNLQRKTTLIAQYLGPNRELLHSKLIHVTQLNPKLEVTSGIRFKGAGGALPISVTSFALENGFTVEPLNGLPSNWVRVYNIDTTSPEGGFTVCAHGSANSSECDGDTQRSKVYLVKGVSKFGEQIIRRFTVFQNCNNNPDDDFPTD
ncbi:hypothetical protein [Aquimarina spinulae]|uniref:hypothetical protein n=1 Tax=Aquimarina spinulae TaxID=1192023 RepID=UPI000D54C396|nr:hypothetical protein [Aquimarina spinulae]